MSYNLWSYKPSPGAAIVFLFSSQLRFIGMAFSYSVLIGYLMRFLGSRDLTSLTFFILQTLLILVAPALFAASTYMV